MDDGEVIGVGDEDVPRLGEDPLTEDLDQGIEPPDKAPKPVRCRVGMHHWQERRTEEGKVYRACTICGDEEYHPSVNFGPDAHHR